MDLYTYKIYGMIIRSDFKLPELDPADGPPDVVIDCRSREGAEFSGYVVLGDEKRTELRFPGIAVFIVSEGCHIAIEMVPGADPEEVRAYLLGMVLGVLLHQRQFVTLHASSVASGGSACLFAGMVGAGKSTFASAMLKAGARLLSDDITAIRMQGTTPVVQPGFPLMRLNPEVARLNVGESLATCPQPYAKQGKEGYLLGDWLDNQPRPLRAIYLLDFGDEETISRIAGHQVMIACLPHLYMKYADSTRQFRLLKAFAEVLHHTPVYSIIRRRGLDRLAGDCLRVREHLETLTGRCEIAALGCPN